MVHCCTRGAESLWRTPSRLVQMAARFRSIIAWTQTREGKKLTRYLLRLGVTTGVSLLWITILLRFHDHPGRDLGHALGQPRRGHSLVLLEPRVGVGQARTQPLSPRDRALLVHGLSRHRFLAARRILGAPRGSHPQLESPSRTPARGRVRTSCASRSSSS